MSSDLWKAFTEPGEDLTGNPWAQGSSGINHGQSPDAREPLPQLSPSRLEDWTLQKSQHHIPAVPLNGSPQLGGYHNQNAWADAESSSSTNVGISTTFGLRSPSVPIGEVGKSKEDQDDFGNFEEPVQEVDSRALWQRGSVLEPPQPALDISPVHDPYSGLESLANRWAISPASSPPGASWESFPARPLPSAGADQEAQVLEARNLSIDGLISRTLNPSTSYSAEEWGEFSPEPVVNHSFNTELDRKPTTQTIPTPGKAAPNHKQRLQKSPAPMLPSKPIHRSAALPPTNIPPPSILLSLAARLIQEFADSATFAASKASTNTSAQLPSPTVNDLIVTARLLAGRKLRWKRDASLRQRMSISPAASGITRGMKLAGVDRAETQREDREAAELLRTWSTSAGRLRSAIVAAAREGNAADNGSQRPREAGRLGLGCGVKLPELSAVMKIMAIDAPASAVKAMHCCLLCGLSREERVSGVDGQVLDSFGEWWDEWWGHVACRMFWERHRAVLAER